MNKKEAFECHVIPNEERGGISFLNRDKVVLFIFTIFGCTLLLHGQIFISNGSELHYSGLQFTSGVINNTNGGVFSLSTDYPHSNSNYVNGPVTFTTTGVFDVSLGDEAEARAPNFTIGNSGATVDYRLTPAPSGTVTSPLPDYQIADAELYTLSDGITDATATVRGSTTFGGNLLATSSSVNVAVVFSTSETGPWSDTFVSPGFMSFAGELNTLTVTDYGDDADAVTVFPNPLEKTDIMRISGIQNRNDVHIELYSLLGQKVMDVTHPVANTIIELDISYLESGTYILRVGEDTVRKIIVR